MAILKTWYVLEFSSDPYQAPECKQRILVGTVFGHPKKPDGTVVRTTSVAKFDGLRVTTQSGTEYELEQPSPEYKSFAEERNPNIDWSNPFR